MKAPSRWMTKLAVAVLATLSLATEAWAERGPYFVGEPPIPEGTKLVTLGWLNILDPSEDEYDPRVDGYFTPILLERVSGGFETGRMFFDCELIDDGPYGAWSCRYKRYQFERRHENCWVNERNWEPDWGPRFSCQD